MTVVLLAVIYQVSSRKFTDLAVSSNVVLVFIDG